ATGTSNKPATISAGASSQGFFLIAASTLAESATGLSDAAWPAGASCEEVALSPLPPQAASNSAGTSASIAYNATRRLEIRFDMQGSCKGCVRGRGESGDCSRSVGLRRTAARHVEALPFDRAGEFQPPDPAFGSGVIHQRSQVHQRPRVEVLAAAAKA